MRRRATWPCQRGGAARFRGLATRGPRGRGRVGKARKRDRRGSPCWCQPWAAARSNVRYPNVPACSRATLLGPHSSPGYRENRVILFHAHVRAGRTLMCACSYSRQCRIREAEDNRPTHTISPGAEMTRNALSYCRNRSIISILTVRYEISQILPGIRHPHIQVQRSRGMVSFWGRTKTTTDPRGPVEYFASTSFIHVPSIVPGARPSAAASSPADSFLVSSPFAFRTSMRPP